MTYLYSSERYAKGFRDIGPVVRIECLDIWAQARAIPDTEYTDAIGIYPMCAPTCPASKEQLVQELQALDLATLVLVTDPFTPDQSWFGKMFEYAQAYKPHFTVEGLPEPPSFSKHHRYYVRRAQQKCETRIIQLSEHLEAWQALYDFLVRKHELAGLHQFSLHYFESLSTLPEITAFGTFIDGQLVSASLWAEHENWVTSHLSATNDIGYQNNAGYAGYDYAIRHYANSTRINLGGAPDAGRPTSQLESVKKGFSNATRPSWICGVVADHALYAELCQKQSPKVLNANYFPAYRSGQ